MSPYRLFYSSWDKTSTTGLNVSIIYLLSLRDRTGVGSCLISLNVESTKSFVYETKIYFWKCFRLVVILTPSEWVSPLVLFQRTPLDLSRSRLVTNTLSRSVTYLHRLYSLSFPDPGVPSFFSPFHIITVLECAYL